MTGIGQPLQIWDLRPLPLAPTEVSVRIGATGVCRSDHHRLSGALPIATPAVLGHEACGEVLEVGAAVTRVHRGDRVVLTSNPECGRCWFCVNGQPNLCETTQDLRSLPAGLGPHGERVAALAGLGSFREELNVDQTMVVPVETDLPDDQLALLGCGVITGVGAVLNTARVEVGATVAVVGCGGVGLACVQGAVIAGAGPIIGIDPVLAKRQAALKFGATDAIDPSETEPEEVLRSLTSGRGADYTFELVGTPETIVMARRLTRRGGTTVLVGAAPRESQVTFSAWDLHTEGQILGCSNGSANMRRDIPLLVRLAEAGRLDLGAMVSRRAALEDLDQAFAEMERGAVIRTVVVPG